jgi:hypothetical protein
MTDRALAGYARAGYSKAGIYRPKFDRIVKTLENVKVRTFAEIIKSLEA